MSDFKVKVHQIRYLLVELTALPRPLAVFKGPASKGQEEKGRGMGWKRRGEAERKGKEGEESRVPPPLLSYFDH